MKKNLAKRICKAMSILEQSIDNQNLVHMSEVDYTKTPCGSIACFGGHYAYAKLKQANEVEFDINNRLIVKEHTSAYMFGVLEFVDDLGFNTIDDLINWAMLNPVLWGNTYAGGMFNSGSAYGFMSTNRTITLSEIIDHWRQVADRVEEHENG